MNDSGDDFNLDIVTSEIGEAVYVIPKVRSVSGRGGSDYFTVSRETNDARLIGGNGRDIYDLTYVSETEVLIDNKASDKLVDRLDIRVGTEGNGALTYARDSQDLLISWNNEGNQDRRTRVKDYFLSDEYQHLEIKKISGDGTEERVSSSDVRAKAYQGTVLDTSTLSMGTANLLSAMAGFNSNGATDSGAIGDQAIAQTSRLDLATSQGAAPDSR